MAALGQLGQLGDLWRVTRTFTFSRDPVRRRHFLPNLLRILACNPRRAAEGAIHLGLWRHFERYVPELVEKLRAAAAREGQGMRA